MQPVADKLTPLILDALARAAADPAGAPLYASKTEAGLFPNVSAAKPAAKKCLDDGLLQLARTDAKGKARELYAATDRGLNYLVEHASPKEVIDDFVRLLEERRGEVRQLLGEAKRIADGIEGLVAVVSRLNASPLGERGRGEGESGLVSQESPSPLTPFPQGREGPEKTGLTAHLLAALHQWSASTSVARDCPLPDLYRALPTPPSVGEFHDALRQLHREGRISLHPWTGPLYALPEPLFALMVGHEIAYYVHSR